MNVQSPESSNIVCDAYLQQIDRYERAIDTAKSLTAAFSDGRDASAGLRMLDQMLNEVAELQKQIEPFREHVLSSVATNDRMQEVARQLADAIKVLIDEVGAAEDEARQARDRLVPELSQETRRQKMRATYGKR